jgi:hypothetical protein
LIRLTDPDTREAALTRDSKAHSRRYWRDPDSARAYHLGYDHENDEHRREQIYSYQRAKKEDAG